MENFEKTQKIDESTIICENCKINNKSESYNKVFYICLFCKKKLCPLCKGNHDKTHNIIKYEEKDSICFEHGYNYNLYCETCSQNLCTSCENDHPGHEIISLGKLIPKEKNLNKKINDLKDSIGKFKDEINNIINILNKVKDDMDKYYQISKDIIYSFNIKTKNYEMLYNINKIDNCNDMIMEDINKIIKEKKVYDKFIYIFNIYSMMNSKKGNIIKNDKELINITYINYIYFIKKQKVLDDERKNNQHKNNNNYMNYMNMNNMNNFGMNNMNYMNNMYMIICII